MRILVIDSATEACSVGLFEGDTLLAGGLEVIGRGHAERLVPMIAELPGKGRADRVVVSLGPGSFTGVRIGLAAARALALALDRPVVGLTTLEVVAAAAGPASLPCLVALESKRDDLYVQAFAPGLAPLDAPAAVVPSDLAGHLGASLEGHRLRLAGDAQGRAAEALAAAGYDIERLADVRLPDAAVAATLAAVRVGAASETVPAPLYLRPPDATPAADPDGRRRC